MRIAYRLLAAVLAAVAAIPVLAQQTPYRLDEGWGKLPDADLLAAISRARNEQ